MGSLSSFNRSDKLTVLTPIYKNWIITLFLSCEEFKYLSRFHVLIYLLVLSVSFNMSGHPIAFSQDSICIFEKPCISMESPIHPENVW